MQSEGNGVIGHKNRASRTRLFHTSTSHGLSFHFQNDSKSCCVLVSFMCGLWLSYFHASPPPPNFCLSFFLWTKEAHTFTLSPRPSRCLIRIFMWIHFFLKAYSQRSRISCFNWDWLLLHNWQLLSWAFSSFSFFNELLCWVLYLPGPMFYFFSWIPFCCYWFAGYFEENLFSKNMV